MTLHFTTRLATFLATVAALTALVAPAALARPDGYLQDGRAASTNVQESGPDTWYAYAVSKGVESTGSSQGTTLITDTLAPGSGRESTQLGTTFITDTLAPGSGTQSDVCTHAMPVSVAQAQACSAPAQPTSAPAQPVGDGGFDWGILGIALGGAFALLAGLYGGLRIRSHNRPATV